MGFLSRLAGFLLLLALAPFVSCSPVLRPFTVPVRAAYFSLPLPLPTFRPRCPAHHLPRRVPVPPVLVTTKPD